MKDNETSGGETGKKPGVFLLLSQYRTEIIGLSAVWILLFHEWEPILTGHDGLVAVQNYVKTIGFCGVDICLFLSAMGLVRSIGRHGVAVYYERRLRRVYLPFFLMGIVYAVVKGWTLPYFLMCVTGVSFFRISMYCFLWFIPAILIFYLLFPLYYHFFRKVNHKGEFTLAVILVWFLVEMFVFTGRLREDLWGLTNRIPVFLIGVYAGCLQEAVMEKNRRNITAVGTNREAGAAEQGGADGERAAGNSRTVAGDIAMPGRRWGLLVLCFIGVLILCEQVCVKENFFLVPVSDCFFPVLCLALTVPLLQAGFLYLLQSHRAARWIGNLLSAILKFFGRISLELYCVQELIGSLIRDRFRDGVASWKLNLIIIALSIAAGVLLKAVDDGILKGMHRIHTMRQGRHQ